MQRKENSMSYIDFLKQKSVIKPPSGFDAKDLNENLFDFQHDIVKWACKRGKSALFAGTGLGKSLMELSFADQVVKHTGGNVLIFTPLAVAHQMKSEGEKFGIKSHVVENDKTEHAIQITNYQKLEHFDLSKYDGVVLDESSILKNQTGKFRTMLIEQCKQVEYRLAATATPSPNDFMELGNHAEFCGIMSYTDMLSTFFVHDGSSTQNWRLKGHAESAFWKWMATWSVMLQDPDDLGYDGSKYKLPKLHEIQHTVDAKYAPNVETGLLFPLEAQTMSDRLKARRGTIEERVDKCCEIVNEYPNDTWVIWCNLNDESAMLADKIPDAVEIVGSMKDTKKEQILEDFANGKIRVLVSKPSLTGFGMNWQHCHRTAFVGLNDSFEQIYQALRRFYRFGQKHEVYAHFIASEIEGNVVANIKRKQNQAEHMMREMVKHTSSLSTENLKGAIRETLDYNPQQKITLPSFL